MSSNQMHDQLTADHARAAVADKISVGPDASVRELGLILSFLFYFLFSVILVSSFVLVIYLMPEQDGSVSLLL